MSNYIRHLGEILNPEINEYLLEHKLPSIYEALIAGMIIMRPPEPLQYILDCLAFLKRTNFEIIFWDMFIPERMKPVKRPSISFIGKIFDLDQIGEPSFAMYQLAYGHFYETIKLKYFNTWMRFHMHKIFRKHYIGCIMATARTHHYRRKIRRYFTVWRDWSRYSYGRRQVGGELLRHACDVGYCRLIFRLWNNVCEDARRTREYFEMLERGDALALEDDVARGTGETRDDVSNLPRNIAIKILGFLNLRDLRTSACVCRSWNSIVHLSQLWTQLDFSKVSSSLSDKTTVQMLQRSRPFLTHVNFRGCVRLSDRSFTFLSLCRNIQDLNLSECRGLEDRTVDLVTKGCVILLFLNLSFTNITDASLRSIYNNCQHLQYLSIAHCDSVSDRGLEYLAQGTGSPRIVVLDLSGCCQFSQGGFEAISRGCPYLKSLILNDYYQLTDDHLEPLLSRCHTLTELSMLGAPHVTDRSLNRLASNKSLKVLKIDANSNLTDASLKTLCRHCSSLQQIYMPHCVRLTDSALRALSLCRAVTVINVADCMQITDAGVRALIDSSSGPKIRELNLSNCLRVSDVSVVAISRRCLALEYLSICFCENITEVGVDMLAQLPRLYHLDLTGCSCGDSGLTILGSSPNIRSLAVSECSDITDLGLQKFAQSSPNMSCLDLSFCDQLTDSAIKNLAFCCRLLQSLNLAGCRLLTDLSVQYLSGVCRHLVLLDISGCTLVTDKGVKFLKKGCTKLQTLIMLYCTGVPKETAIKLSASIPYVRHSSDEVPVWFSSLP